MTIKIESVQIQVATEHLLVIGLILQAALPRIRRFLKKKK
jgi:hypothetical protein